MLPALVLGFYGLRLVPANPGVRGDHPCSASCAVLIEAGTPDSWPPFAPVQLCFVLRGRAFPPSVEAQPHISRAWQCGALPDQ